MDRRGGSNSVNMIDAGMGFMIGWLAAALVLLALAGGKE